MTIPNGLLVRLSQQRLIPFVGSGVSLAVCKETFPTWGGLLERLGGRLKLEGKEDDSAIVELFLKKGEYNKAAEQAVDNLGAAFRDEMKKIFDVPQSDGMDLSLPQAIWELQPPFVVTTNYDNVLEWAKSGARPVTNTQKSNLVDLFDSDPDRPPVWHLHGHISDPDSLILAPKQYDQLYRPSEEKNEFAAARQKFQSLIGDYSLLFIGFGMEDEYVMQSFSHILERFGGRLKNSYALLRANEKGWDELWEKYGIQPIEFENYGEDLVKKVREIRGVHEEAGSAGDNAPPPIPQSYIDWLTRLCDDIAPFGMESARGQSVSLQQVYVPLKTQTQVPKSDQIERPEGEAGGHYENLLLQDIGGRSLYLAGGPGTGKSTFCRWLALTTALGEVPEFAVEAPGGFRETLPDQLVGRLPLLIPLRDLSFEGLQGKTPKTAERFWELILEWLDKNRSGGLTKRDVHAYFKAGRLLLILDGVDEVALALGEGAAAWSPRDWLIECLSEAAKDWITSGHRILVTSRPYGLSVSQANLLSTVKILESQLQPLASEIQQLLANRWFSALPRREQDPAETAKKMLYDVEHLAGDIKELARNPLLLTAICIIYGEGNQLPQDKHTLYDRIVRTTLCNRFQHQEKVIDPLRKRLSAVAEGMHTGKPYDPSRDSPQAAATYEELDQILSDYMQATPETESGYRAPLDAREELLNHSGLLEPSEYQKAQFHHLSFQEFLVAERMVLLNPDRADLLKLFEERAHQTGWRPTLDFVIARKMIHPGWQSVVAIVEDILERIKPEPLSESIGLVRTLVDATDYLLRRDLQLKEPFLESIRQLALRAIQEEIELKTRFEVALLLGRIGDPRVSDDINDPEAENVWCKVLAGEYPYGQKASKSPDPTEIVMLDSFEISRYPVTNAQYARFVEAGGYTCSEYWSDEGWKWTQDNSITEPEYWHYLKWNGATQPVVGVSWYEASAYCCWAGVRLPTEKEWEAAARGTAGLTYSWDNDWVEGKCNSGEAKLGVTSPVGMFPVESPCGAIDMNGNVWEWCEDWYDPSTKAGRVLRGGSWDYLSFVCRSAVRYYYLPDNRNFDYGFRVART